MKHEPFKGRSVTLNRMLEEQQALNMRLLLAVQLQDQAVQQALKQELEENNAEINRLLTRRL